MTTQEIVEKLSEIQTRVANEQLREATARLTELNDHYADEKIGEKMRFKRFLLARDRGGVSSDGKSVLNDYTTISTSIQAQRSEVLTKGARYVSGHDIDTKSFLATIKETRSAEKSLLETGDKAGSIAIPDSLPASVELLSISTSSDPIPKGTSTEATVIVDNVGDRPETGVELGFTSGNTVTIEPEAVNVGEVTSRQKYAVRISGQQSGQTDLQAELTSEGAGGDLVSTAIHVIGKQEATETAKVHVNKALQEIRNMQTRRRDLESKLSKADAKLEDALRFIEKEQAKEANNQLTAASRTLGSFLNQTSGQNQENNQGSNGEKGIFSAEEQVKAAIDIIATAKKSNI